jgi:ADP-heptose:LPS heptosyltransferase/2-polyprenyl-3-methyl-5-hydroxy-6-metoxy-1,4-benzoquinol methylase/glycosyltransferase involved in cell wall biosynthesis
MTLVSCILPTYNRRELVERAIRLFQRQDYPERELIVVDDGTDCVADLADADPRIRYLRLDGRQTIGAKRNLACREARGEIVVHWDDDDWAADWRVSYQARRLIESGAEICGLDRIDYFEPATGRAWEYVYPEGARRWVAGNTLCYRRSFQERHPFPDINVGEDARFVWQAAPDQVLRLEDKRFIVATVHDGNVSPKATDGSCWRPVDGAELVARMAAAVGTPARKGQASSPRALVAAALGIGDILRCTPLVRVLAAQGYRVDLLIRPDYAETIDLVRGAPEVCDVWTEPPRGRSYEVAVFSLWAATMTNGVSSARVIVFDRGEWLRHGDSFCVEKIARELGWSDPMPAPFAVASARRFNLPAGTIALHTGCKPDWPWKKWHGFDELAALLPEVALIGTEADLRNEGTYFARPFRWPAHVRDFVGKLSLWDTAALLGQCAALVSNDSGMMHLGAALGIPTIGVFGITSPEREGVPTKNFFPISKGLECEPACRAQPWGRRDCEHHLRCLKEMSASEVMAKLDEALNEGNMRELSVTYYGHVFDASGYGNAARAYIHALRAAGVELSVVDLSGHERQVRDDLVEGLVGRRIGTDFHIFHGIPHVWAQHAFRVRNGIAMTVWETDTMPTQWRNTLNHVLETWLPCEYNVAAFQSLAPKVAKLPHPVMPRNGHHPLPDARVFLGVEPDEFVVYSIFEWQERKSPLEQFQAYLRAFRASDRAVLIVKTNPAAADAAAIAVAQARAETGSDARVEVRAEAWSDTEIEALHARGDCYLSLHRGEGWCYPLFDAACKGVPVVATAYSGPLEYLDGEHHQLVTYKLAPVEQRYMYYHPAMHWAAPDVGQAAERLRWVRDHREEAVRKAAEAAAGLNRRYALEEVGLLARGRLLELLRRTNPTRYQQLRMQEGRARLQPAAPVPASWYDADYFENGIKSNWTGGYSWTAFQRLFHDTAAFLRAMFPLAESYLDAGCAKGFLVKALREAGKEAHGFDASAWAIEHAEAEARPFVTLAGVEDYVFDRPVDVLTCFDLLPHLTEEQAAAFLRRARERVRIAAVAVIATYTNQAETDPADRDFSRVTRQTREWWDGVFRAAGWRQGVLGRNFERLCQQHELPRSIGWTMYVYAPE